MLNSISNLGTILTKSEQQTVNGGQRQCGPNEVLQCVTLAPGYTRCHCVPRSSTENM